MNFCINILHLKYHFIGPLLDDWLKEGTPKALKGLSSVVTLVSVCLSVCMYVCLSVCDQATGHSFRPCTLIFFKYVL